MAKYEVGYRKMNLKMSTKLSQENKDFLGRIGINRAFALGSPKQNTFSEDLDLLERYFKLNNDEYKDMVQMEDKK